MPDMKDYATVIEHGLKKLKNKNYDSWSMLVRLCFDNPYATDKTRKKMDKNTETNVNPVELMRFHPVFNKLDLRTVKLLL